MKKIKLKKLSKRRKTQLSITITYQQTGDAQVNPDGSTPYDPYDYHVGDEITVNNEKYYVITDSLRESDYVVALKENLLSTPELNEYGGNRINNYVQYTGSGMYYYNTSTCGYTDNAWVLTDCKNDYDESDVKYVVDAWAADNFGQNELKLVNSYRARIITIDEYQNISAYNWSFYSSNVYWTMSKYNKQVYGINLKGNTMAQHVVVNAHNVGVRPVINVYKSAITQS